MSKPHKYGNDWRTKNRRTQKRAQEEWEYFPSDPEQFIAELREKLSAYEDPQVSMETYSGSYRDPDEARFTITGWRNATAEEVAIAERNLTQQEEWRAERLARAEAELRSAKPELFKEGT